MQRPTPAQRTAAAPGEENLPCWRAPLASSSINATVRVPGSKSITNRALILAALSTDTSVLSNILIARDTSLMLDALTALGVGVNRTSEHDVVITPGPLTGPADINCGLAGTLMRFVPPVASLAEGRIHFDGDEGARTRPMAPIIESLRSLGVAIDDGGRGGLPFDIAGTGHVTGGQVTIDASGSSQFVSGLMLSAARFDTTTTISHRGGALPSLPHVEMTIDMVTMSGGSVDVAAKNPGHIDWTITPSPLKLGDYSVEPDLSNASVFLAAAMVTGGTVTVPHWPTHTTQPGDQIRDIFTAMGGHCEVTPNGLTVTGPAEIAGIDVDLRDVGELTPTIVAVSVFAAGPSTFRGIAHLRGHETDRLAALVTEVNRLGGQAHETADGLTVSPQPLHAAQVETYHDHRMATFAAIIGLRVPGVDVVNVATTAKTMPDFPSMWIDMLQSSDSDAPAVTDAPSAPDVAAPTDVATASDRAASNSAASEGAASEGAASEAAESDGAAS